jgi:hypothetical protein
MNFSYDVPSDYKIYVYSNSDLSPCLLVGDKMGDQKFSFSPEFYERFQVSRSGTPDLSSTVAGTESLGGL